jgi:hypothetical protein
MFGNLFNTVSAAVKAYIASLAGSPSTLYVATDTYANISALTPAEGTEAYATDGGFVVKYIGGLWIPQTRGRVVVTTGTSLTLDATHKNTILRFTSASAITLTANTAVAAVGFSSCVIQVAGTGQLTISGTATRANLYGANKSAGQYAQIGLDCSVAGTFDVSGDVVQ